MSPSLSISFVTWRTPDRVLAAFCQSLLAAIERLPAGLPRVQIHAIINDAPDAARSVADLLTGQARAATQSDWRIHQGQGNVGYGAAQNLAIRQTQAEYHLLANPDLTLAPDTLAACMRHLEQYPETVLAAPQGHGAAGGYARLAKREPSLLVLALRALAPDTQFGPFARRLATYVYADRLPSETPQTIHLASGCFMFCRTAALKAVGGFDERYFLYFDDFDLCRRLAAQGRIQELPDARIVHLGGRTAQRDWRRRIHFVRSAILYFAHYGWRLW